MADPAEIPLGIDLDQFLAQLRSLPGITAKEAEKVARVWSQASVTVAKEATKQAASAEKSAKRAADAVARSAQQAAREIDASMGQQLEKIETLSGAAFGGVAGDIFDLVNVARGASGGLAAVGIALGGIAVGGAAIGGAIAAVKGLGDAAVEALPAVQELVGTEAALAVQSYERSTADAAVAASALTVELGALAADGLAPVLDEFVRITPLLVEVTRAARGAGQAFSFLADVMQNQLAAQLGPVGVALNFAVPLLYDFATAGVEGGEAIRLAGGTFAEFGPTLEQAGISLDRVATSMRAVAKEAATVDPDSLSFLDAGGTVEALPPEVSASWAAYVEQLAAANQLSRDLDVSLGPVVADLAALQSSLPTTGALFVSAFGGAFEAATQLADAVGGQLLGGLTQLADIQQRQAEQAVSALEAQEDAVRDRYRTEVAEAKAAVAATTGAERQAAEYELALLESRRAARLQAIEEQQRAEQKAARDAFKRSQSLQRAAAIIEAARAAVSLIPAFALLGPGAPIAAAAVAAAGLDVQLRVINSAEPPKFAFGGQVGGPLHAGGDVPALLERGEAVVSNRGMAQPGAREIVEALNAGLSMPRIQEVYLDGVGLGATSSHRRPGAGRATMRTRYS